MPMEHEGSSTLNRRATLKGAAAGAAGMAGLSGATADAAPRQAKSVIFVFLTGGLSHHDTYDMKPDAPPEIRGEFKPVATKTPGIQISEHLPRMGKLSNTWSLLRSMETGSSGHENACHMMLTGRLDFPPGFSTKKVPSPNEWPSIPAVVTFAHRNSRTPLPPAAVLPEPSVNEVGRVRPGQYAGRLGVQWDAWHIDIAAKCTLGNGACPDCFRFEGTPFEHGSRTIFDTPVLTLPPGGNDRFNGRLRLLSGIQDQQRGLDRVASGLDRNRQQAVSVLTDPKTSSAFDVERADPAIVERYGKNKFGLSCLMARRLVEAGVRFVQVNLGKNSSWDTHRRNFVNLKDNLLPPMDLAVSALLEDLSASGLLDETLVIVSGEFGRTPKINKDAGRDHWGPCNTMLFAGGGVPGGRIVGSTDRLGASVTSEKVLPQNFAATVYNALGIPRDAHWIDLDSRPHHVYAGDPIRKIYG